MITNYEIKKDNNEEVLYIHLDFSDEFGKFNFREKQQKLEQIVKDFMTKNKINFNGTKVAIVMGGIAIGTLLLNNTLPVIDNTKLENNNITYVENIENLPILNNMDHLIEPNEEIIQSEVEQDQIIDKNTYINNNININVEEIKQEPIISTENTQSTQPVQNTQISEPKVNEEVEQNNNYVVDETTKTEEAPKIEESQPEQIVTPEDTNTYVTIYRTNGTVITLELEEYIIGVVGAEMPASFNEQALMAQAIIARTYTLKALENNKALTDNSSTQNYKSNDELKVTWGSEYNYYYLKIKSAVDNTKGMYLTYNGKIIDAVYHSTSNGYTEDSRNVWGNAFPYLVSVESPYDSTNKSFISEKTFTYEEISTKLQTSITMDTSFNILSYTEGNRVGNIEINGNTYTGVKIRSLLGLRSATFEIQKSDTDITFITKGYGHGVGMSQYGANGMAKNGYSYEQILKHYYTGVTLNYS